MTTSLAKLKINDSPLSNYNLLQTTQAPICKLFDMDVGRPHLLICVELNPR